MNENNENKKKFSKNKAILNGENTELILKKHPFFENLSTRDLIKMICRIRSFEKGLIKRNLTEKEIALKEEILKQPMNFLRTNLILINEENMCLFTKFNFKEELSLEKEESISFKETNLLKYTFYQELLCFLESAQRLEHNHLKYLDYYHVLEYFITDYSYKNLENSIKYFVSLYLEGSTYEQFKRSLKKISEDNKIVELSKDEPLIDVLKQIDYKEIVDIINKNRLFNELKKDIFGIENSRLIIEKWANKDIKNINKLEINEGDKDEFYTRLKNRIYNIRNILAHSQSRFRGKEKSDFLPTQEYEDKLKEDVILIKEIAIRLCKCECINFKN